MPSTTNMLRSKQRFVVEDGAAGTVTISEGECIVPDHDLVRRYPEAFEREADYVRRQSIRSAAEDPRNREAGADFQTSRTRTAEPGDELRSAAMRANDRAEFLPTNARAHMERELRDDDDPDNRLARFITAAADRDYFRAFAKVLNDPVSGMHLWSPEEREAVQRTSRRCSARSRSPRAAPQAGSSSRTSSTRRSSSQRRRRLAAAQISRVATTAYNEKRFVTSTGVTAHWDPEETESTDDSPTLLQPAIVCKKGAADVIVSYELFEDSDIAQQVGNVLADAKAVREAAAFTITESNGPTGIITALVAAGGSTVIATGTNVLAQGDLYANQAACRRAGSRTPSG
jgi:predicted phage gp36 major capsid-like protein